MEKPILLKSIFPTQNYLKKPLYVIWFIFEWMYLSVDWKEKNWDIHHFEMQKIVLRPAVFGFLHLIL